MYGNDHNNLLKHLQNSSEFSSEFSQNDQIRINVLFLLPFHFKFPFELSVGWRGREDFRPKELKSCSFFSLMA